MNDTVWVTIVLLYHACLDDEVFFFVILLKSPLMLFFMGRKLGILGFGNVSWLRNSDTLETHSGFPFRVDHPSIASSAPLKPPSPHRFALFKPHIIQRLFVLSPTSHLLQNTKVSVRRSTSSSLSLPRHHSTFNTSEGKLDASLPTPRQSCSLLVCTSLATDIHTTGQRLYAFR